MLTEPVTTAPQCRRGADRGTRLHCVSEPRNCVVSSRDMHVLTELLSSRVRAEVFRALFGVVPAELHGRDLARSCGVNEASLRHELRRLVRLGLVRARRRGNRVYYSADDSHPLHPEIHRLVLKTSGLVDVLREAIDATRTTVAFVFGSVATETSGASSDIDLLVIGGLTLRELATALQGAAERVGREINPHRLTEEEYRQRLERGDHFVTHVIAGPKIFVVGSQDDLAAMAGQRLAEG